MGKLLSRYVSFFITMKKDYLTLKVVLELKTFKFDGVMKCGNTVTATHSPTNKRHTQMNLAIVANLQSQKV